MAWLYPKLPRRRSLRRFFFFIHKWLGLSAGAVFVLLSLTGSLLVFYVELDRQLNPQIKVAENDGPAKPISEVIDALRELEPQRKEAWRLELPDAPGIPIMARYYKPEEKAHLAFAPLIVTVNPYTLEVSSKRFWGEFAMTWIYDLHYTLLLDRTGKTLLGISGILMLTLIVIGVFLWWPKKGKWISALTIKRNAHPLRRVYDLHTVASAYSFPIVGLLLLTGIILVVPGWFNPIVEAVSPQTKYFNGGMNDSNPVVKINADQAAAIAMRQFPEGTVRWVETPSSTKNIWRIVLRQPHEVGKRFPRTNVWISAQTGEILAVRDPNRNSGGDTFFDWLHPLHNGEAFGLIGRLAVFIGGLIVPVIFVTGIIRWRQKTRANCRYT